MRAICIRHLKARHLGLDPLVRFYIRRAFQRPAPVEHGVFKRFKRRDDFPVCVINEAIEKPDLQTCSILAMAATD